MGKKFGEAVDRGNFGWLNANWEIWREHKDLLDGVVAKGAGVTVRILQSVSVLAKQCVLAALFDKGEEKIDGVLGRISYDDYDLARLTNYRPELAGSSEKFFRILDKIEKPRTQEWAVRDGVENLFSSGRHDLVVPLVNALGKRTFKSGGLRDVAIQKAFYQGARRGNQDIVEEYCEHPAITSEDYANGLNATWNGGEPNQVFLFLLKQADRRDLDVSKKMYADKMHKKFRQAIDKALKTTSPAGPRYLRPIKRARAGARIAKNVLAALGHGGLVNDTIDIITGYASTDDTILVAIRHMSDPMIQEYLQASLP